jgi:hypothetical protein
VDVAARLPDGSQTTVARLATNPDWPRRYWLVDPLRLPRGARLVATVRSGSGTRLAGRSTVAIAIDVVTAVD